jgi:hypothetical protein
MVVVTSIGGGIQMAGDSCKGRHKGHLCVLVSEKKFDEIKKLAGRPKFLCFNCGRVANSASNLCNPMPLEK